MKKPTFKTNILLSVSLFTFFVSASYAEDVPYNYNSLSACEKQDVLWKQIKSTEHRRLPELSNLGAKEAALMAIQRLSTKTNLYSDVAPKPWKKYLHKRGVVAKVKFEAVRDSEFTGLFKGAKCGLVRLSLTYKPNKSDRDVAPGLALKLFRDKEAYSSNVSALYTLSGQGKDYNFFANALSNIVPMGDGVGLQFIHSLFKKVTGYPEQLLMTDFAESGVDSLLVKNPKAPRQLFFVPNKDIVKEKVSSMPHDFRNDIMKINKGSLLHKVYAVLGKNKFDYSNEYTKEMIEGFMDGSTHIGDLITTSDFKASEFGDSRIFFRHEVRAKSED